MISSKLNVFEVMSIAPLAVKTQHVVVSLIPGGDRNVMLNIRPCIGDAQILQSRCHHNSIQLYLDMFMFTRSKPIVLRPHPQRFAAPQLHRATSVSRHRRLYIMEWCFYYEYMLSQITCIFVRLHFSVKFCWL